MLGWVPTKAATSGPEPKPSLQCKKSPFVNHVVVAARRAAAATAKARAAGAHGL